MCFGRKTDDGSVVLLIDPIRYSKLLRNVGFVVGLVVGAVVLSSDATHAADNRCWTDDQLLSRKAEAVVRRGHFAYVPPPDDVSLPAGGIQRTYKRAVRRFKMRNGEKVVALTFDIGEQPHEISGYQGKIIDFLRRENVRATLFLGGKWMLTHQERAKQLIADPLFEVANHGWEHRNFRLLSPTGQQRALMRTQTAYEDVWRRLKKQNCAFGPSGRLAHLNAPKQMNLFRFPFGACRESSLKLAGDAALYSVQWDVSSSDPWKGQTAKRMHQAVLRGVKPGSIVLFHANGRGWHTSEAIPSIVRSLRDKGYKFLTIGDLLEMEAAEPVLTKTCFDSKPGDTNRYDALSRKLHAKYARFIKSALAKGAVKRSQKTAPAVRPARPQKVPVPASKGRLNDGN